MNDGQAAAADGRNGTDWSDVTFIHATRWQDEPLAQVSYGSSGYPNPNRSKAWEIWRDRGAHVSIAVLIEMQMRHGMPPFQQALDHGILPSLSPDVDTNMTTDPFSLMRGAFTLGLSGGRRTLWTAMKGFSSFDDPPPSLSS